MTSRRGWQSRAERYPRTARINEVLREVVAEELERLEDRDERLGLLTVTGVAVDRDLAHATVYLSSLPEEAEAALAEHRGRIQAAVGRQVRMRRTPQLAFVLDPAVQSGARVEEILRDLKNHSGVAQEDQTDDDAAG